MNRSLRGVLWAGAALAAPAIVNAVIARRAGRLEPPLPGDIAYYDWTYGCAAYYRQGSGEPLLLVHTPNAGGSSWEWRKVFPALADHYTVYALDLLGFGLSGKPDIPYSGRMLAELVHDFCEDVIGQRTMAIGSTLGAAYLVNIAVRRPELLGPLVLVNPTGLTDTAPAARQAAFAALRAPVLGRSLYHALTARAAIARELKEHIYYDTANVTPDLVDALYRAAHQPGSQHAAAAFIAGQLDLPMRMAFSSLTQPVQIIWGRDAWYTPVGEAVDLLYRCPHARLDIVDACGMLPQDEKAGDFLALVRDFLGGGAAMGEAAA